MFNLTYVGTKEAGFLKRAHHKPAALILLFLIACASAFAGGAEEAAEPGVVQLDAEYGKALDGLMAKHPDYSMQVAFGTFTYEYTGLPSSFSRYLEEALAFLIVRSDKYRLFNRNVAVEMDPVFREQYKDFFETNMVGGLLSGRFFDEGSRVRVRVELTNLRDGNLVGSGDLVRSKKELPPKLSIEPVKETRETAAAVDHLIPGDAAPKSQAQAAGALSVAVSTDRGAGASYEDGELMKVFVSVNKDAWVKVYHIDVHGTVQLIWPNRFGGTGLLRAGSPVPIPADGDPFEFLLERPYGTEFIKVVASTQPFEQTEADFSNLRGSPRDVVARGLRVKDASSIAERAEALASYYIGPKVTTVFE